MKIIDFEAIKNLEIKPSECVNWVIEAFKLKHQSILPPKISTKIKGNIFFNTMPCLIPEINKFSVKEVYRYPLNTPSLISEIMLYDTFHGKLLAVMDGTWITAMRTGAVAAVAISILKKEHAKNIGFIGLGNTARATLLCLLESNEESFFEISLLVYKDQHLSFIDRFKKYKNVRFTTFDTQEMLIRNSDVIVSCVTSSDQLMGEDEWYKEGVLVVPVHTRGFQNCDLFFDKVFVDDIDHVKNFKYFSSFKSVEELSNVILEKVAGRESEKERIIAYNIGIALHDTYFASQIYNRINTNLADFSLESPIAKFWI
ncbi:ornithine cyclodeaminase [Bacteroidales bacterium OttesenSCG-928-B11]|nr:ornithine cyclodeaminase [Bacteroidales bacterium OttesenSCG-928-E04]MDL2309147.1 ornithine cyclodeaminase [Bacteroidales bacterium OttesenSCG-928-C03]MDL2312241.1 ornithine cyclodeaminase [Bacteroidales bacterium OttesenSCG-928-B11]